MTETQLNSYKLPLEGIPGLKLSDHVERLVELREFLDSRGIRTKNTRLERYTDYLRCLINENSVDAEAIFKNVADAPFNSQIDWMLYILREVHELMWILKGLKVHIPTGIDEKLKIIVGGRDFAALDTDSSSRNAQFELRIASYFCQGGCDVDISTETDIIALSNDQAFYIECKRVSSENQLSKRLSEAKKQLQRRMPKRHGERFIYGCIAVDVTKIAFSHNGLTWAMTNDHSKDIIQEKLIRIATDAQRLQLFRDCRNLFGYWFQIHIPSLVLYPQMPITRFSSCHDFRESGSRKQKRAVKAFCNIFESAIQEDSRNIAAEPLTLRKAVEFPKGTQFSFDKKLLDEFFKGGTFSPREKVEWQPMLLLTISGKIL